MAAAVSILVHVETNTALSSLDTSNCRTNGDDWSIWPDQDQILEVHVSTEGQNLGSSEGEIGQVGDEVGLVQTLTASKRIATYQGGGKLIIIPDADLPCLDGQSTTAPFFDAQGGPQPLPASGEGKIILKLVDGPSVVVPYSAHHPDDQESFMRPIEQLNVEEQFLISLWNKSKGTIIAQWSWGYSYKIMADNVGNVQLQSAEADQKTDSEIDNNIVTDEDAKVAGAGQVKGWTHGFNHPDVAWEDQGGDLPRLPAPAPGPDQAGDEQEATEGDHTEQESAEEQAPAEQEEPAQEEPTEEEHSEEEPAS